MAAGCTGRTDGRGVEGCGVIEALGQSQTALLDLAALLSWLISQQEQLLIQQAHGQAPSA